MHFARYLRHNTSMLLGMGIANGGAESCYDIDNGE
jgi:hypothetical protein